MRAMDQLESTVAFESWFRTSVEEIVASAMDEMSPQWQ
jgi:hypothetical protein